MIIRAYASALYDPDLPLGVAAEQIIGISSIYYLQKRFDEALVCIRIANQV